MDSLMKIRKFCGHVFVRNEVFNRVRNELNKAVDHLQIKLNDAEAQLITSQHIIIDQESRLKIVEQNNDILLKNAAQMEAQLIASQNKIADLEIRMKKVEENNDILTATQTAMLNREADFEGKIKLIENDKSILQNKVADMTSRLSVTENNTSWLQKQLDIIQNKADNLQLQLNDAGKKHAQEKMETVLVHQQLKGELEAVRGKLKANEQMIDDKVQTQLKAQVEVQVQASVQKQLLIATAELRAQLSYHQETSSQLQAQVGHLNIEVNNVKGLASVSYLREYTTLFNHQKIKHFTISTLMPTIKSPRPSEAEIRAQQNKWLEQTKNFDYEPFNDAFNEKCASSNSYIHTQFNEMKNAAIQIGLISGKQKQINMKDHFIDMNKAISSLRNCLNNNMHTNGLPFNIKLLNYAYNNIISHPRLNMPDKFKKLKLIKESLMYIDKNLIGQIELHDRIVD